MVPWVLIKKLAKKNLANNIDLPGLDITEAM
jgi:hypothetical protein